MWLHVFLCIKFCDIFIGALFHASLSNKKYIIAIDAPYLVSNQCIRFCRLPVNAIEFSVYACIYEECNKL